MAPVCRVWTLCMSRVWPLFVVYVPTRQVMYGAQPQQLLLQQKRSIAAGVARALEHLHTLRLVHLDLKPRNVLLGPEFQPKL